MTAKPPAVVPARDTGTSSAESAPIGSDLPSARVAARAVAEEVCKMLAVHFPFQRPSTMELSKVTAAIEQRDAQHAKALADVTARETRYRAALERIGATRVSLGTRPEYDSTLCVACGYAVRACDREVPRTCNGALARTALSEDAGGKR